MPFIPSAATIAAVAPAAIAGGSLIAGAIGSGGSSQNQTSTSTSGPTSFNQPYIQQQFTGAQNQLNASQASGPYTGELYAPTNSNEQAAAQQATNFGMGAGNTLVNSGANSLTGLYNNTGTFSNVATGYAQNGAGYTANSGDMNTLNGYGSGQQQASLVNGGLSSALNSAATTGANSIGSSLSTLNNVANTALQDPTSQIGNDASSYVNNSALQSQMTSANNAIAQTLNEQTLPGINQSAANGGSLNSSRAGAANAMAQGQAATAMGSTDSSLINNAYNTGMSTATSTYENGLNAANSAASNMGSLGNSTAQSTAGLQNNEGQFNTTTQLGAANSALTQQQAGSALNANTALSANSQLGQGIFDAALGTNNVMGAATTNTSLAGASGNLSQSNQQQIDNAGLTQFNNSNAYNWGSLGNYANLVDNPSYSTSTGSDTTTNSGPGFIGTALGTASALNGLTATGAGGTGTVFGNLLNGTSTGSTSSQSAMNALLAQQASNSQMYAP